MANNDKENKIEKFTKEAIGKTLNQFNKEIGVADLVEINKNQDRILNGILSQVNDESTEKTEKSNIITLDNSTDGIVELKEIQGDTNVNVSKIEEMPITHDIGDKEGNVFTLNEITKGAISIGEIQGNTMVNCNKDDKKELVLMKDLSTQGDNNITLTEGVDGGLVDVALEGNTLVNVSKTKDSTAITMSYTAENSGNHVALQGEYDGKCRPVIEGNTLVNLSQINKATLTSNESLTTDLSMIKPSTTYTRIVIVEKNTLSPANSSGIVASITNISADERKIDLGFTGIIQFTFTTPSDLSSYSVCERIRVYAISTEGELAIKDLLLEGDYTNKPIPDYFDGLQSSFEDRVVPESIINMTGTFRINNSNVTNPTYTLSTNLKANTVYTRVYHVSGLVEGDNIAKPDMWDMVQGDTNKQYPVYQLKNGWCVNTFTNLYEGRSYSIIVDDNWRFKNTNEERGFTIDKFFIIEGDWSNYDFSDYDPTKAGKYRVDYKVTGKNKFDISNLQVPNGGNCTINNNSIRYYATIDELSSYNGYNSFDIEVKLKPNTIYSFKCDSNVTAGDLPSVCGGIYIFINGVHTYSVPDTTKPQKIETDKTGIVSFKFIGNWTETKHDFDVIFSNIQLEEGDTLTSYEPYKGHTKTLYLNSPLLEGDTIEQQNNNIVHVHRYSKVVLDGGASPWGNKWWESTSNTTDTVFSGGLSSAPYEDISYCDKLLIVTPSNLSSYDTAITIDGESIIRVNIPKELLSGDKDLSAFRTWLNANPITLVGKLKTPQYEVISTNDTILCDSYTNGHLDVDSIVPVERVNFLHFEDVLTYLYANTQYTVQFVSDKAITADITLGGTKLLAQNIVEGLNRVAITTPSELVNNKLVISGVGANIREIVVTDTDREFKYFEGMKSVGECEDLEVVSSNKNLIDKDKNSYLDGYTINDGIVEEKLSYACINRYIPIFGDTITYTGFLDDNGNEQIYGFGISIYDIDKNYMTFIWGNDTPALIPKGAKYIKYFIYLPQLPINMLISQCQLECSSTATDYIPHAHNTQTLTHEPLRAVGDIKDKYVLIDGKWYIERNCGEIDISTLTWNTSVLDDNDIVRYWAGIGHKHPKQGSYVKCNILPNYGYTALELRTCEGVGIKGGSDSIDIGINLHKNKNILDSNSLIQWITNNSIMITYQLASPTYEPIDYNPLTVYSDITHISNNSTIPCNMTIKNTGYNCLLKPSTTYTVSSNLGLNTVTTGADIGDSCLRFYDEDTSDKTTMKNVLVLEGDWSSKTDLIPSNFSGIESCFEHELVTDENDANYGKYKVTTKVVGKNLININDTKNILIGKALGQHNGTYNDTNYNTIKNIPVTPGKTYSFSNISWMWTLDKNKKKINNIGTFSSYTIPHNCYYLNLTYLAENQNTVQLELGNKVTAYEPYKENNTTFYLNEPLRGVGDSKDRVYVKDDKVVVQRNCSIRPYEDGDFGTYPTDKIDTVYPLAEPTYEEVEYSSNRLILDTFNNESFNNSTLLLDTNISPKLSFKPLWEELVYVKSNTKYYIQFNAVGSGEVIVNLGGTESTTEIVEGYNCIPITTPNKSTNLMTISGQGITISEVVVSEVVCGGYYKGLQSCFEEHMENGKYVCTIRGIALDGSKVNGIKLYINEPLRGVNDTKDRLCIKNGKLMVERKCGEIKLDENSNIISLSGLYLENTVIFKLDIPIKNYDYYICDNFECYYSMSLSNKDVEGTYSFDNSIRFRILRSKLNGESYKDFKQWLQDNPTTVVYQLAEPVYEEATNEYGLPIVFEGYENGIVYIDSAVTPTTHIKYTSNNQLATTLAEAEEQNTTTQEDINMNVVTYMMDIDMILTEMEMSNDISVMAVRRDSSNENMLDRMSEEDKKVYRDNTVVMLEKMITANVLEKEDIEGRINMYYNKNRISKEQYEYLKSLL